MADLPAVFGIDPGAKYIGVVMIDESGHLRVHDTITRPSTQTQMQNFLPWAWVQVVTLLRKSITILEDEGQDPDELVLAIEDTVEPKPIRRNGKIMLTNPKAAIETAGVQWYLAAKMEEHTARLVVIPPNRNGERHLDPSVPVGKRMDVLHAIYEPALIGPNEKTGTGHGKMSHQRAAYDVAHTARERIRLERTQRRGRT